MERLARMNPMPSANWDRVVARASLAPPPDASPSTSGRAGGGDFGSMKQKTAARQYRAPTMMMTACGPARLMTSGPRSANPIAKAALRVSVKTPFAASSWFRGTTSGIIAASAGAKNTVTVDTKMFSSRISRKLSPTRTSAKIARPRRMFVATRTSRRSTRST